MNARGWLVGAVLALSACTPTMEGPATPPGPSDAERTRQLSEVYERWTADDSAMPECAVYFTACADVFARRAGFDPSVGAQPSPRALLGSPDPTWIPGWERIPADGAHSATAFAALTWGAAMRAHFGACDKAAAEAEAKRSEGSKRVREAIDAAQKEPDRYKRLGELVRLRKELMRTHPSTIGPRYEMELALRAEFVRAGLGLVYDLQKQRADDAATLRPALAAADERDVLCLEGLPTWQDEASVPSDVVRVGITAERRAELERRIHAAQDLEQKLPEAEVNLPAYRDAVAPDPEALFRFDKDVLGAALFVKKAERDAKTGTLRVELGGSVTVKDAPFDCRDATQPSNVKPDGKINYERVCKRRDETRRLSVTLILADAPDFAMQKDDQLAFLAKVKKAEQKTKATAKAATIDYTVELEGVHVLEIWRQQLLAADYFVE